MFDPWTIAAIALKTSLLLAVAGLLAGFMTKRSAAWRHLLLTAAMALTLLMPLAVVYLPSYVQVSLPWQVADPGTRPEAGPVSERTHRATAGPEFSPPQDGELAIEAREVRAPWPGAAIVWLVGALIVLLRSALAHVGLLRWIRRARTELSPAWAATLKQVTREAGVQRSLRVLESDHAISPCTWGFLRPVLLLPAAGAAWAEPQRRFALLHELAHVRRFDYLTTQLANLACAVHWYNPFAWFASAQAGKFQEQACDDAVLRADGTPSDYARFLAGVADDARRRSLMLPAAVGMVQRSQLHGRVSAILDASVARLPLTRASLLVALLSLACLSLFLATVSAAAAPLALQPGIPLTASFNAVELRNGGNVLLVHGPAPSVTLRRGDPRETGIVIREDGRLVIDRCTPECSDRHDLEIEIVTPGLAAIAVAEGGTIQSRGDFPEQPEIAATVAQGGTIDIRSMTVAGITASVASGGRIYAKPLTTLSATVEHGGAITWWGNAKVQSSIRDGGVVIEGPAADADRPLTEMGAALLPAPAPVPHVPPVPPIPARLPQGE